MMEQIPDLLPQALVYFFDAGSFSRTVVASDRSAVGELRYDNSGRPILVDPSRSTHLEYLDWTRKSLGWLHRNSELITMFITNAHQLLNWARRMLGNDCGNIRLTELPKMAGESADIREIMYLSELHFLHMARIANASDVPPRGMVAGTSRTCRRIRNLIDS